MAKDEQYSAKDIQQLDQRMHVRHRVSMYLGSASDEGLTTGIREYADNSFDEILNGHGNEAKITFYPDGSAEVSDNGRGLPVDENAAGVNGIILTVGTIASGGKFSGKTITGGTHGVGASAFVACSTRTDATVFRGGKKYQLSFKEGLPGFFAKDGDPDSKFTDNKEMKISKDDRTAAERKKNPTGTILRSWPDYSIFIAGSKFLVDDLKFRFKSTAFLIPGSRITVEDAREEGEEPVVETYHFDGGLVDMLSSLTTHPFIVNPVHLVTESSFSETKNMLNEAGDGTTREEVKRDVSIDLAFAYNNTEDTFLRSYVNIINTKHGGTHEGGLWRALSRTLINYIKNNRGFLKAKEEPPTLEDVRDGFAGIISIKFPEPSFTGQEKATLSTQQMTTVISQAVGAELQKWLTTKKNARQAKLLGQRIVEASRIRLAARQQKDVARKKSALETSASMPAKLVPAALTDPEKVELMLCEGDSALGGLKQARDSAVTAIFPLRGKPLNAYDLGLGQILKNQEWTDFIQIIGAGVGKEFSTGEMNYSRVILLADSDADGSHIRALLIAGIYRLMPELIQAGRLYAALPPLFSITTMGKKKEKHYALNDEELPALINKLKKRNKTWEKIVRHKGLGEYDSSILHEVVMDPETRVLKQITIEDAEKFEEVLELTMGKNAAGRRSWILENRELISDDAIDT